MWQCMLTAAISGAWLESPLPERTTVRDDSSGSSLPIRGQTTLFGSPRLPSSLTRNFGTRNSEMPLTPCGASGNRARTRWMMLGVIW